MIGIPIIIVVLIVVIVIVSYYAKKKDKKLKVKDIGFGDAMITFKSVDDAKKSKLTEMGFGIKYKANIKKNKFLTDIKSGAFNISDILKLGKLVRNESIVNVYKVRNERSITRERMLPSIE